MIDMGNNKLSKEFEKRDKLQPESSLPNDLLKLWTPVFNGVTTFFESVIVVRNQIKYIKQTEHINFRHFSSL